MPIYGYRCECGELDEKLRPIADREKPITCKCGKEMKRRYDGYKPHHIPTVTLVG